MSVKRFPDGELKPQIEKNIRKRDCFYVHNSSANPCEGSMLLNLVNNIMSNSSASEINDVIPYMRFSRQDRKDQTRVPISSAVIAKNIASHHADRVITLDVHNPAVQGVYDAFGVAFDGLHSFNTAAAWFKRNMPECLENAVVMSPDEGGAKRANSFVKIVKGVGFAVGYKVRDGDGEIEELRVLGKVAGKNVLIVDDILDSGNTLLMACEAAKKAGAKRVYAYCTRGLFTKGTKRVTDCLDGVVVGDTLKQDYGDPKVRVIGFAPLFAEAIYRISTGESLSKLFD